MRTRRQVTGARSGIRAGMPPRRAAGAMHLRDLAYHAA